MLPGIGAVYAERIVAERQANGVFTSVRDLQRVRGIGPKTAAKLEPLVSFDRP
ncbi:MAG: helix-hairpin-helix domain-containing protein [Planctomycetota bacterium]